MTAPADRMWWLAAALLVAVLLVPLVLVPLPPIADYPNHLARMFVLANGAADPFLSQVYAQRWDIIPNIGIDVIMPPMLKVMSVYAAGRVMLALALLLPTAGTVAYNRAVFGTRSWWPLGSGLVAYNGVFLLGFMNFLIGIGIALLAAAAWIRWRDARPLGTVVALIILAGGIFFIHIFGLLFLGLLIGSHELIAVGRKWRGGGSLAWSAASRFAVCALVFALPIWLYLSSALGHGRTAPEWLSAWHKIVTLCDPFSTFFWPGDALAAGLVVTVYVACLVRRRAFVAPEAIIAIAVLMELYPVVPFAYDAAFIDTRFPVMAAFLIFAGFAPRGLPPRLAVGLTLAFSLVFVLRMAILTTVWLGQNQDVADMRAVIAHVPRGSRVLLATVGERDNPAYWNAMPRHRFLPASEGLPPYSHLAGMLVIERGSIWPLLFTVPAKQPLVVRPSFQTVTKTEGTGPDIRLLAKDELSDLAVLYYPYLVGWTSKYDYLLVMPAGGAGDLAAFRPDRLELVAQTDIAALLKVRPPP